MDNGSNAAIKINLMLASHLIYGREHKFQSADSKLPIGPKEFHEIEPGNRVRDPRESLKSKRLLTRSHHRNFFSSLQRLAASRAVRTREKNPSKKATKLQFLHDFREMCRAKSVLEMPYHAFSIN
jgi:hypothetical protein